MQNLKKNLIFQKIFFNLKNRMKIFMIKKNENNLYRETYKLKSNVITNINISIISVKTWHKILFNLDPKILVNYILPYHNKKMTQSNYKNGYLNIIADIVIYFL